MVTVILTLAVGLSAATAMVAIVNSVLVRPLALPHPEELVLMSVRNQRRGTVDQLSYRQIDTLRRNARSFTAIGAYNTTVGPVGGRDGTRVAVLTEVTPQFFKMLGTHPKLGRLFLESEKAPVAIVSEAFWRERLHGDPNSVGSSLRLLGHLYTVIGVLPAGLHFPQGTEAPVVYTPIRLNAKGEDELQVDTASAMGRIRPGISMQQALADARNILNHAGGSGPTHETLEMHRYADYVTGDMRTPLLALLGGAVVLLLISFANATNLQIVRITGRLSEMTVRSALGASFRRILQQLATESVVLSLLGAAFGAGMAAFVIAFIRRAYGAEFSRFDELTFDWTVFGISVLLAVVIGLLASFVLALTIRRRTSLTRTPANRITQRSRVPGMLVALQIGLTCVLLATSGLFFRTIRAMRDVKLGFDPKGVTTLVLMPDDPHKDPERARQTDARLLERLENLPGVESATMQSSIPFSSYNVSLNGTTDVGGRAFQEGDTAFYSMVSSNFVRASGIRLLRGRGFRNADDASDAMAALVNKAFAQKYLTQRNPIGATIRFHRKPGETDADLPFTQAMTVVGVVENELQGGNLGAPYEPMVYLDYLQLPKNSLLAPVFSMNAQFAIRSGLQQAMLNREVREAVKEAAPDMAEMKLEPMEQGISQSLGTRRIALGLVAGFAALALILSAVGIYGVLSYSVALRRREIGIRMALGSSRSGVVRLIARQAGVMVLCGLLPGVIGAWSAGTAVKSFLFGVSTLDPPTLCAVTGLLLIVCATAAVGPGLQAMRVDPMEALRAE